MIVGEVKNEGKQVVYRLVQERYHVRLQAKKIGFSHRDSNFQPVKEAEPISARDTLALAKIAMNYGKSHRTVDEVEAVTMVKRAAKLFGECHV